MRQENGDKSPPLLTRALRVVAWPMSVAIGWWWGNDSARNSLYDTLKHADKFKEPIRRKHWDNVNQLVDDGLARNVSIVASLGEEHAAFDGKTAQYMEKLGFKPWNTLSYLRGVHKNEALKAIMTGFGAGGIALGVMLTMAENKSLEKLLLKKEQDEGQGPAK
ncbi:MAG: hypothetical protein KGJ06_10225 [Pseudomonadota bacterium]|nr:hypothetical protein [Pseudomonadota bacterium]